MYFKCNCLDTVYITSGSLQKIIHRKQLNYRQLFFYNFRQSYIVYYFREVILLSYDNNLNYDKICINITLLFHISPHFLYAELFFTVQIPLK